MFCVVRFTSNAKSASASMPSGVNVSFTPSVASNSTYCFVNACFGSVKMRKKSARFKSVSSTRIVNRPGRDEQNVIGPHRAVTRVDSRAFDHRQQIALHALARHVGAVRRRGAAHLVQLVEEDDAMVLDEGDGLLGHGLAIDEGVGL